MPPPSTHTHTQTHTNMHTHTHKHTDTGTDVTKPKKHVRPERRLPSIPSRRRRQPAPASVAPALRRPAEGIMNHRAAIAFTAIIEPEPRHLNDKACYTASSMSLSLSNMSAHRGRACAAAYRSADAVLLSLSTLLLPAWKVGAPDISAQQYKNTSSRPGQFPEEQQTATGRSQRARGRYKQRRRDLSPANPRSASSTSSFRTRRARCRTHVKTACGKAAPLRSQANSCIRRVSKVPAPPPLSQTAPVHLAPAAEVHTNHCRRETGRSTRARNRSAPLQPDEFRPAKR